jgi:hypothetical protein
MQFSNKKIISKENLTSFRFSLLKSNVVFNKNDNGNHYFCRF